MSTPNLQRKGIAVFAGNSGSLKSADAGRKSVSFRSPRKEEGSSNDNLSSKRQTPVDVLYPPPKIHKPIDPPEKLRKIAADIPAAAAQCEKKSPDQNCQVDLPIVQEASEPVVADNLVKRLPVSPLGKWYFEVEFADPVQADAKKQNIPDIQPEPEVMQKFGLRERGMKSIIVPKKKIESPLPVEKAQKKAQTGILILSKPGMDDFFVVEPSRLYILLFDNQGRQIGNRGSNEASFTSSSWTVSAAEGDKLAVGEVIKTKSKQSLKIIDVVTEEEFRGGAFFLDFQRKQKAHAEEKRKRNICAMQHAVSASQPGSGKLQSILATQNSAHIFSRGFGLPRRTSTFSPPFKGLVRTNGGIDMSGPLVPKFDPDAPGAVVVYRAPYERDTAGRKLCSVVVDPVLGARLRPHQIAGVRFLYECISGERLANVHYGAILADEMGLGKSIQAVALIWTCLKQGAHGAPLTSRVIITAPCSLVENWRKEFEKWLGEGAVRICSIAESTPKGNRILSRFESEGDVLIISYDQLRKYVDRIAGMQRVGLIVCDEGHKLKNAEVKTTVAIQRVPTKRRVILSGTPIQNDLSEFHSMVSFVNPGILGSLDVFKRVFQDPILRGRDPNCEDEEKLLGQERAHYLSKLTARFILRRKQSLNEKYLPKKCEMTLFCPLSAKQQQLYEEIVSAYDDEAGTKNDLGGLVQQPFTAIMSLRQLSCHAGLLLDSSDEQSNKNIRADRFRRLINTMSDDEKSAKLRFLIDLITQCKVINDKIVVVSNFTATLNIIARELKKQKIGFLQLDGTTPIKKRQSFVDEFNLSNVQTNRHAPLVFLLSSKAGGVGLNLVGANRLVLFDPDWNPANDAQAMGRVWRDGQKKTVYIYRLLSTGTIEEKIFMRQVSKQGLSTNIVDSNQDSKQHFTLEDLRMLFKYNPTTSSETHDLLKCEQCGDPSKKSEKKKREFSAKFNKPVFKGPVRMEELHDWAHVNTLSALHGQDSLLHRVLSPKGSSMKPDETFKASSVISFIFCVSRDPQKIGETASEVIVEDQSALETDAAGIVIAAEQQDSLADAHIAFSQ